MATGMAAILVLLALPGWSADPLPADPAQVPVAFTGAEGLAAGGNLAIAPDGQVHFVWHACPGVEQTPGCFDVYHRSYDPALDRWSNVSVVLDAAEHAFRPQIHVAGDDIHLLWRQGPGYDDEQEDVLLGWCVLPCGQPSHLSEAGQVMDFTWAAKPDGRAWVAWQQEEPGPDARVLVREQDATGQWRPTVAFDTGAETQRSPALAVDAAGTAHVAWRERPPEIPESAANYRFFYATVERGRSTPSEATMLSHDTPVWRQNTALVVDGTTLHAVYGTREELYHRHTEVGSTDWSQPVNVSRTGTTSGPRGATLHATGDGGILATWVLGGIGDSDIWAAERIGGIWSRPHPLIDDPAYQERPIVFPAARLDDAGRIHLAWTGEGPGVDRNQMHYRLIEPAARHYTPPEISDVLPSDGAWTNLDVVRVSAKLSTDAGADPDSIQLAIDGKQQDPALRPDGSITANVSGLPEGTHEAVLRLRDLSGNEAREQWAFHVDRTPPTVEAALQADGVEAPSGWVPQPVHLHAESEAGDGAPAAVQISFWDTGIWMDLDAGNASQVGMEPVGDTWILPEDRLLSFRVRAIDQAGNVAVGPAFEVGWDATPPDVQVHAQAWSRNGTVHASFSASGHGAGQEGTDHHHGSDGDDHGHDHASENPPEPGSPVIVEVGLHDDAGDVVATAEAPLEDGAIAVDGVAPGIYTLRVAARDAAGNIQEFPPTAVGVDPAPPELTVDHLEEELLLRVGDGVSGVSRVVAEPEHGETIEVEGGGRSSVELRVPLTGSRVLVLSEDVAGNVAQKEIQLTDAGPLVRDSDSAAHDVLGEDTPSGQQAPALPTAAVLLAAILGARRLR